MSDANFYHEFERNFRGSREEIRGRLERGYGAFLDVLARHFSEPKALDLGCGRGEWLEMAEAHGFSAHGVDLDEGMLADCFSRGLSATHGDAIAYLADQPDDSLAVVSGFHIAEHLPFEVLQRLIREAVRALRPGGLLILETPNAENLSVGTLTFHMDPTHVRPLPPGLLSFLARHYGFERAEVLRLQENAELRQSGTVRLMDVFQGVSPDYSVVAQKAGPDALRADIDAVYAIDRGLTLDILADRFESTMEQRSAQMVAVASEEFRESLRREHGDVQAEFNALKADFDALKSAMHLQKIEMETQWVKVQEVYTSTSWRVTWPIRFIGDVIRRMRRLVVRIIKAILRRVIRIPAVRKLAKWAEPRFPALANRARRILHGTPNDANFGGSSFRQELGSGLLSPRAKQNYAKLAERTRNPDA